MLLRVPRLNWYLSEFSASHLRSQHSLWRELENCRKYAWFVWKLSKHFPISPLFLAIFSAFLHMNERKEVYFLKNNISWTLNVGSVFCSMKNIFVIWNSFENIKCVGLWHMLLWMLWFIIFYFVVVVQFYKYSGKQYVCMQMIFRVQTCLMSQAFHSHNLPLTTSKKKNMQNIRVIWANVIKHMAYSRHSHFMGFVLARVRKHQVGEMNWAVNNFWHGKIRYSELDEVEGSERSMNEPVRWKDGRWPWYLIQMEFKTLALTRKTQQNKIPSLQKCSYEIWYSEYLFFLPNCWYPKHTSKNKSNS